MLTTVAAGRVYDYSHCIGMYSQSGQGFWAPQDFVLGKNGRVYVLSRGVEQLGQRISKIDLESEFQGQFGSFGGEDGRFIWPRSLDLDHDGRVFVSDEYSNRISVFDPEGAFRYHWGRTGSGEGELNGPSGLAFDSNDNIWVVDSMNHRVQRFSSTGEFQLGFGEQGANALELSLGDGCRRLLHHLRRAGEETREIGALDRLRRSLQIDGRALALLQLVDQAALEFVETLEAQLGHEARDRWRRSAGLLRELLDRQQPGKRVV